MEDVLMSVKEADRYFLFKKHEKGECSLLSVSKNINLCYRQVLRLAKRYKQQGKLGLISKKQGMLSSSTHFNLLFGGGL